MFCPFCGAEDTKVVDSRLVDEGSRVRRRRECAECNERFTSFEAAELNLPRVIKRDGRRSLFEVDKLRHGMLKALEKRPISIEAVEKAIAHIVRKVRASGEREVSTRWIGELVMEELRALDAIAFVRFASVYQSFDDVGAFQQVIQRLKE